MRYLFISFFLSLCAACDDGKVYEGELRIDSAGDVALLDGVTIVDGNLVITAQDISELSLNTLESVEGNLWITSNSSLERLSIDSLSTVSGFLNITRNPVLQNLSLNSLSNVGGTFAISYNCELPSFRADAIAGQVSIGCNDVDAGGTCVETGPNLGDVDCLR